MAELDRAAISIRLAKAREEVGLTQPQIAELLEPKTHFRTVQDWESPKMHVVPFDRLDEWARLTRTSREWLLYGDGAVNSSVDPRRLEDLLARLERLLSVLEQERQAQPPTG